MKKSELEATIDAQTEEIKRLKEEIIMLKRSTVVDDGR